MAIVLNAELATMSCMIMQFGLYYCGSYCVCMATCMCMYRGRKMSYLGWDCIYMFAALHVHVQEYTHRSNMYTACTAIHTGATCIQHVQQYIQEQHVYNSMSCCILCDFVYHGFLPSSSLINIYNVHVSIHVVYSKFFLLVIFTYCYITS